MQPILFFFLILAWPVSILGLLAGIWVSYLDLQYHADYRQRALDKARGVRKTFHPFRFWVPSFLAMGYLVVYYSTY